MSARRKFSDLSPAQQRLLRIAIVVQLSLSIAAWVDLARRPASTVRGPKPAWALAIAVNFVGPIAYFLRGRRQSRPAALAAR